MAAETPQQTLCLSCGICCEGTLFSHAKLETADTLLPLRAIGIAVETNQAGQYFTLPCPAHRDGCCQTYAVRPAICWTYRCKLLKKYESGASSWAEAQQRIGRVQMLKKMIGTELERIVPEGSRMPVAAIVRRVPTPEELAADSDLRTTWAPVMLLLSALRDCLQTHFRSPRKESGLIAVLPLT